MDRWHVFAGSAVATVGVRTRPAVAEYRSGLPVPRGEPLRAQVVVSVPTNMIGVRVITTGPGSINYDNETTIYCFYNVVVCCARILYVISVEDTNKKQHHRLGL